MYKGSCLTSVTIGPSSDVVQDGGINLIEQRIPKSKWGETSYGAYIMGKQHCQTLTRPNHIKKTHLCVKEDFHLGEEDEVQFRFEKVWKFEKPKNILFNRPGAAGAVLQTPL